MSEQVLEDTFSTRKEALQALGVMTAALFVATMAWQGGPQTILWIFSFCLFLMTLVSTTLFVIEGRVRRDRPDPTLRFCRPAILILGFSAGLFFAAGFWAMTGIVIGLALFLAAYRRRAAAGDYNLIPQAAREFGLIAGIGVALAGIFLIGVNAFAV